MFYVCDVLWRGFGRFLERCMGEAGGEVRGIAMANDARLVLN